MIFVVKQKKNLDKILCDVKCDLVATLYTAVVTDLETPENKYD